MSKDNIPIPYRQNLTDYHYFNALIPNNTANFIRAEYNQTFDLPLLRECQDYVIAVERFAVPSTAIPLFKFIDDSYRFSFSLGLNDANPLPPVDLQYVRTNDATLPPFDRVVFYYTQFIKIINKALFDLWTNALGDANYIPLLAPYGFNVADAPYMRINSNNNKIELVLPVNQAVNPATPFYPYAIGGINILLNSDLFSFLHGFRSYYFNTPPIGDMTYKFRFSFEDIVEGVTTLPALTPLVARPVTVLSQEYSSLFSFSRVSRLFFTTTTNIVEEDILVAGAGGTPNRLSIFTDFEIPPPESGQLRETIYYFGGSGELRYHNFSGTGDLRRFEFKAFYMWDDFSTQPLLLPPNFSMNVKFQLKRRLDDDLLQYTDKATLKHRQ